MLDKFCSIEAIPNTHGKCCSACMGKVNALFCKKCLRALKLLGTEEGSSRNYAQYDRVLSCEFEIRPEKVMLLRISRMIIRKSIIKLKNVFFR